MLEKLFTSKKRIKGWIKKKNTLKQKIRTGLAIAGIGIIGVIEGCGPYIYNERTDGRILTCKYSLRPECDYVIDTVTGEYWELCPRAEAKKFQLDEVRRVMFAEKVRELMRREYNQGRMMERFGAGAALMGLELLQQKYGK